MKSKTLLRLKEKALEVKIAFLSDSMRELRNKLERTENRLARVRTKIANYTRYEQ